MRFALTGIVAAVLMLGAVFGQSNAQTMSPTAPSTARCLVEEHGDGVYYFRCVGDDYLDALGRLKAANPGWSFLHEEDETHTGHYVTAELR